MKRKLEVESNATERVEGSVKDAEDHLNAKDYDLQQMLQQLEALKCRHRIYSLVWYQGFAHAETGKRGGSSAPNISCMPRAHPSAMLRVCLSLSLPFQRSCSRRRRSWHGRGRRRPT